MASSAGGASGHAIVAAEDELTRPGGDEAAAGIALGEAIADWSTLGGYELEAQWDVSCRRIARTNFEALTDRRRGDTVGR
jgi:hypothetical protein